MIDKILDNTFIWDLSRYFLDLTCGLYKKRTTFLKNLGLFKDNPSVLDIGCGTGFLADITQGYYVGIDSNCHNISQAKKKRYKKEKIFRCVNLNTLQEEKAMFDVVLIVDVLHHLNDQECADLFRAVAKITKKYLVSFDAVLREDMSVVEKWLVKHDKGNYFRHLDKFNQLFQTGGFKIIENCDMHLGYFLTHFTICCLEKDYNALKNNLRS